MEMAKQIVREFWIAFVAALGWTAFNLGARFMHWSVTGAITHFASAFFLVSYFTGNIIRIRKQARVEKNFGSIESRIDGIISNLETRTRDVIAHVTGGDSFCHLIPNLLIVIHTGAHPLYGVSARAVDLDLFDAGIEAGDPFAGDYTLQVGDMSPKLASMVLDAHNLKATPWTRLNVFFSARNGLWTQELRRTAAVQDAEWATRVTRNKDDITETLFEHATDNYPRLPDGQIEWG